MLSQLIPKESWLIVFLWKNNNRKTSFVNWYSTSNFEITCYFLLHSNICIPGLLSFHGVSNWKENSMQWKRYLHLVKPCEVAENWKIPLSIRCCGRKLEFLILLPVLWRFLLILVFTCLIFTLHVNKTFFIKEEHYVKWFQQTWNQQKKSTASVCLHVFCSICPIPSQSKDETFSKTTFHKSTFSKFSLKHFTHSSLCIKLCSGAFFQGHKDIRNYSWWGVGWQ